MEGGQTSTGSAVAWYRRLVGEPDYAALNEEAAAVPPGCEGVLCLDHFQVRAPAGRVAIGRCVVGLGHWQGNVWTTFRCGAEGMGTQWCASWVVCRAAEGGHNGGMLTLVSRQCRPYIDRRRPHVTSRPAAGQPHPPHRRAEPGRHHGADAEARARPRVPLPHRVHLLRVGGWGAQA